MLSSQIFRPGALSILLSVATLMGCATHAPPTVAPSSPTTGYTADADEFAYPKPVHYRAFTSQGQTLRMAYLDESPAAPTGLPVVLLHGKNFHAGTWNTTIDALVAAGHRVVAPDQLGFGKSSKPVGYAWSFAQLAANTHALLGELGIDRAVIVGHSMGGMLATRYALLYPNATARLVLVNPIGLEDYAALTPPRTVDDDLARELQQTPDNIIDYQRNAYYAGDWKAEYLPYTALLAGWTQGADWPRMAVIAALTTDMIFNQPVVHDLSRLTVPTTLIIGTRDRTALGRGQAAPKISATMGDYTQLGKLAAAAIPGATLIELDDLGHVPQVEAWDRFWTALAPQLARP